MQRNTATSVVVGFLATAFAASWIATGQKAARDLENSTDNETEIVYLGSSGVTFQDRSHDCGIAALIMVFEHYGLKAPRRTLESQAKLDFRGANLLTIKELAKSAGLEAEGWRLAFNDLRKIPFPAILFVESHHYIVVDSIDQRGHLFVRDPSVGRLKIPRRRVLDIWKGETLVISRGRG